MHLATGTPRHSSPSTSLQDMPSSLNPCLSYTRLSGTPSYATLQDGLLQSASEAACASPSVVAAAATLRESGVSALELRSVGVSAVKLAAGGFSPKELRGAGYTLPLHLPALFIADGEAGPRPMAPLMEQRRKYSKAKGSPRTPKPAIKV